MASTSPTPGSQPAQDSRTTQTASLWVGNIPFAATVADLQSTFGSVAQTSSVKIISDSNGRSRGFAIVAYHSHSDAQKAIDQLNNTDFDGRNLEIRFDQYPNGRASRPRPSHRERRRGPHTKSHDTEANDANDESPAADGEASSHYVNHTRRHHSRFSRNKYQHHSNQVPDENADRRVFVRIFNQPCDQDRLESLLQRSGTPSEVSISRQPQNNAAGFANAYMATADEATAAISNLNNLEEDGTRFEADHFRARPPRKAPVRSTEKIDSSTVFVKNLPFSTIDDELAEFFRSLSLSPQKATVLLNHSSRSRGSATVEFQDSEAAYQAIESAHQQQLGGRPLMVRIYAPSNRGKPAEE